MNTSLLTFFQVNTAPQKDETIDVMSLEKEHTPFSCLSSNSIGQHRTATEAF